MKVTRTFHFNASGSGANAVLRAFMPRLPDTNYDTVLVPDSAGTIQTYAASSCGSSCEVSNWRGTWLADDDGNGTGVMVIRSPSTQLQADVLLDTDGYSNSDVSAIELLPPQSGWSGKITETEYLCFYDAQTWTTRMRDTGAYPTGCKVSGL